MNNSNKRADRKRWLGWLVAFSPAFFTAWLIHAYAVNMPNWDDWERVPVIEKWHAGTLTLKDLYAPHIDHRMFFPRVLMLVCNELSGGNLVVEMWMSWLLVVAAAAGVVVLLRRSWEPGWRVPLALVFLLNLLLFSAMQYENWLWAVQTAFFMPMTCIVWAVVVVTGSWAWWTRLLVAGALALVATHSFGHGFTVWPAVFMLMLLREEAGLARRDRILFVVGWTVLAVVTVSCYLTLDFNNSSHPAHSYGQKIGAPPPSQVLGAEVWQRPERFLQYVLVLAGSMFSRFHLFHPQELATWIGVILAGGLLTASTAWLVWRLRAQETGLAERALPWLALAWASLSGLLAVSYARMAYEQSIIRATSPRYNSIALWLVLGLAVVLALWLARRRANGARVETTGGWLLGFGAAFLMPGWMYGGKMMQLVHDNRLHAKAVLMFAPHFRPLFPARVDADIDFALEMAKKLESLGQLPFKLVKTLELDQFRPNTKARPAHQATVRCFEKVDGGYRVEGFAGHHGRSADVVLVTAQTGEGGPATIVEVIEPGNEMVRHPYLLDLMHVSREGRPGTTAIEWAKVLPADFAARAGARGDLTLQFWIFDAESERAHLIQGSWVLRETGEIEAGG